MEPDKTPASLGELLRDARERQRITLAQAERDTRVRQKHLLAFEEDDVASFPPPVHSRGLVQAYARYLGLATRDALDLLNRHIGTRDETVIRPSATPFRRPGPAISGFATVFISFAVMLGVVFYLYSQISAFVTSAADETTASLQTTLTVVPSPSPVLIARVDAVTTPPPPTAVGTIIDESRPVTAPVIATPIPLIIPTPTRIVPSPTPEPRGVTVDARISGRVWVQVETDGRVAFSGILNAGDSRTWVAQNKIFMHSGNASFVDVTFNGRSLGTLGAPGEVVKVEWTGRS